jgi:prepilin peptidase CpaA
MIDDTHSLALLFLVATLCTATVTDLMTHRIPNALLAPAATVGIVFSIVSGGLSGLFAGLGGLFIGLAMLMPLYLTGGTSAGDVKLLAVAGVYLGPTGALFAGLFTFMAGAVLGLLWIGWMRALPSVMARINRLTTAESERGEVGDNESNHGRHAFAYAPAIFAGSLLAVVFLGWPNPGV